MNHKQVQYTEIKIDTDTANLENVMIKRSKGAYTVPQIFINDHHVGGCDDLYALHAQNRLDTLLTRISISED